MNKFIEKLEIFSKYLLLLSTSSYILGIIVMNFYLAEYGIYDINPINVTYIIIGIVFLTYLVATFIIIYFLSKLFTSVIEIFYQIFLVIKHFLFHGQSKFDKTSFIISFFSLVMNFLGLIVSVFIIYYFKDFVFTKFSVNENFNLSFRIFNLFFYSYIFFKIFLDVSNKRNPLNSFENFILFGIKNGLKKNEFDETLYNLFKDEKAVIEIKKVLNDERYNDDLKEFIKRNNFEDIEGSLFIKNIVNIFLKFKIILCCCFAFLILVFFKFTFDYSTKVFPSFNRYFNGNINQILFVKFKDNLKTDGQYIKVYESNDYYYFKEANSILKINKSDVELVEIL